MLNDVVGGIPTTAVMNLMKQLDEAQPTKKY